VSDPDTEIKKEIGYTSTSTCKYCGFSVEVIQSVKETASGLNDNRPKLLALLKDTTITRIVVEHKDRLTRFGANYHTLFSGLNSFYEETAKLVGEE
jgi:predicted site-specific integrase-resolvase